MVTFNGKTISNQGGAFTYTAETLPPFTMRVKCVNNRPVVKSGATVTKVDDDIYDITYNNSNWNEILAAGTPSRPNANASSLIEIIDANTDSVTNLENAFYNCQKLEKVACFNMHSVKNLKYAFYNCKSLKEIPSFDTANVNNFWSTFQNCSGLTKVNSLNTSSATLLYQMFSGCSNLTKLPTIDCSSVTELNSTFAGCSKITVSPILLNTGNLTELENTFENCNAMASVISFDTSNVQDFSYTFRNCKSLTSIPALDFSSARNLDDTFSGCTNLVDISMLNTTDELVSMQGTFSNCTALTEVPKNVYMKNVYNYDGCFSGCSSLQHVDISKLSNDIYYVDSMFNGCVKLDNALELYTYLEDIETIEPDNHEYTFIDAGKEVPGGLDALQIIPTGWGGLGSDIWIDFKFSDTNYNPAERQLGVGKAVTGTDKYNQMSKNFSAIWLKKDSTENIWRWSVQDGTNLSNAFVYGDGTGSGVPMLSNATIISGIPASLTLVENDTIENLRSQAQSWLTGHEIAVEDYVPTCQITKWDLDTATDITALIGTNYWFNNCLSGTLPALKSSNITNISYAFDRCWNITAASIIDLPCCNQGANNAYYSMLNLTSLPMVKVFGSGGVSNMFRGCINAPKVSIENSYTTLSLNAVNSHANCYKLCGTNKDSTALDQIPQDWGGNLTDSTVRTIGSSLWKKSPVSYTNNDMEDLTESLDTDQPRPSSTTMQYFNINGIIYYNKCAVEYIKNNIQTLYPGWHISTADESQEIQDVLLESYEGMDYLHEEIFTAGSVFYVDSQYQHGYYYSEGDPSNFPVIRGRDIYYGSCYASSSYEFRPVSNVIMDIDEYYPIYLVKNKE